MSQPNVVEAPVVLQAEELESGTYDELKVRGGLFADLVKRQQIDEE